MISWCRLWHDMPTDPKFRSIARAAKQPLSAVIAVYVFLMTDASANASERGRTRASDEDVASALDLDEEDVSAIRKAMQGRVLDGDRLAGWEKRQPKREDDSAERARAWREAKKAETHPNAPERTRTQRNAPEKEKDTEKEGGKTRASARATPPPKSPLDFDWEPSPADVERAIGLGLSREEVAAQAVTFGTWHRSRGEERADWREAFVGWCQREATRLGRKPGKPAEPIPTIYINQTDAAWPAIAEAYRAIKGKPPPTDKSGGWHFPADLVATTEPIH